MEVVKEKYIKEAKEKGWNVLTRGWPDVLEWKEENNILKIRFVELKNNNGTDIVTLQQKMMLELLNKLRTKVRIKRCQIEIGVSTGDREIVMLDESEEECNTSNAIRFLVACRELSRFIPDNWKWEDIIFDTKVNKYDIVLRKYKPGMLLSHIAICNRKWRGLYCNLQADGNCSEWGGWITYYLKDGMIDVDYSNTSVGRYVKERYLQKGKREEVKDGIVIYPDRVVNYDFSIALNGIIYSTKVD